MNIVPDILSELSRQIHKPPIEVAITFTDGKRYDANLFQSDENGVIYQVVGHRHSLYAPWIHIAEIRHPNGTAYLA